MLREGNKLIVDEHGILRRQTTTRNQLVLPAKYKHLVFEELHVNMGHLGPERVVQLARERFYWPGMESDIHDYITSRCILLPHPILFEIMIYRKHLAYPSTTEICKSDTPTGKWKSPEMREQ